jgi:hypothetical protein
MNLSEFYLFVNPQLKEIKGTFQEQPQDWKKICTFPGLDEDEKSDLSWADLPNDGFVRGERLKEYSCSDDQLDRIKYDIKKRTKDDTQGMYASGVTFNDIRFPVDPESIMLANVQNNRCANFLKGDVTWYKFSRDEMFQLVEMMNKRFEEIVDVEIKFHRLIDETNTVYELSQLRYGL